MSPKHGDASETLADLLEEGPASRQEVRPLDAGLERFEDLGRLATGGMGEVRLVRDRGHGRTLARKILPARLGAEERRRFVAEASITAQLAHPGIVPVHDVGELPDGRLFYTMKVVEGQTFSHGIRAVHAVSGAAWGRTKEGWTFSRLIHASHRVCEAMAYAHQRGVVHRDLKPANLMVGPFGEVLVVDWGLAALVGQDHLPPTVALQEPGLSGTVSCSSVAGTPAYMAPEMINGAPGAVAQPVDVYALGAVLYEILSGVRAFGGGSSDEVVERVRQGAPPDLDTRVTPPLPSHLVEICRRAMERDPSRRTPDAGVLADALAEWIDGARRRARALELVAHARQLEPRLGSLTAQAQRLRSSAERSLEGLATYGGVHEKEAAWALEDQAAELELAIQLVDVERVQLLRAALADAPDLPEGHALLAEHYRQQHAGAEATRDLVRARGRGAGAHTARPGRAVGGELEPCAEPRGPRRCDLSRSDRACRSLGARHWELGTPDGRPALCMNSGALGQDDVVVPAGWAILGDPQARGGTARRRVWVESFVMRRHPVTNRDYLAFLDDLVARGQPELAARHVPREPTGGGDAGRPVFALGPHGRFQPVHDATGDLWALDWPVVQIRRDSALAWCAWERARTGQAWRLAYEFEREKAARGVDGRVFPWGNQRAGGAPRRHLGRSARGPR